MTCASRSGVHTGLREPEPAPFPPGQTCAGAAPAPWEAREAAALSNAQVPAPPAPGSSTWRIPSGARRLRPGPRCSRRADSYAKTPSGSNFPFSTVGESWYRSHSSIIVA